MGAHLNANEKEIHYGDTGSLRKGKGKGHLRKELKARTGILQGTQEFYPTYKLRTLPVTVSFWQKTKMFLSQRQRTIYHSYS